MKINKWMAALCLALMACLVVPTLAPAGVGGASVAVAATKAKLNKTRATLYNSQTLELKVSGSTAKVTWASSDTAVAKVSNKGVVTARGVGKANITAKVGKQTLKCVVTVKSPLSASAKEVSIHKNAPQTLNLTYKLDGNLRVKCNNTKVVTCSLGELQNGKCVLTLVGQRAGTATVTVSNTKTKDKVEIIVTVKNTDLLDSLLDLTAVVLEQGKSIKITLPWNLPFAPELSIEDENVMKLITGAWDGKTLPITFQGVASGETTLIIRAGKDGPELARIKVAVK